jgi:hypothetical protein
MNFDELEPGETADFDHASEGDPWALVSEHLRTSEPVALPADFRASVHRRLRRARRFKDAKLVAGSALVTGTVITFVVTFSLGLDWWKRLLAALQPTSAAALWDAVTERLGSLLHAGESLALALKSLVPFVPFAFLTIAVAALALELALFRYLNLGPFARPQQNPT